MSIFRIVFFVLLLLCIATAWAEPDKREPHIGYLYPAGGQQGTTVYVTAGGQFLKGAADVYISGQGVHGEVVKYYKPIINIKKEQRQLLQKRLKEVRDKRLKELGIDPDKVTVKAKQKPKPDGASSKKQPPSDNENATQTEDVKMPEHPLLEDLDNKSLQELAHIKQILFSSRRKKQINRQLAEFVLIKINIESGAEQGNRELRIANPVGLTSPIAFQVGQFPEVRELEPNDQKLKSNLSLPAKLLNNNKLPKIKPIELPTVLNGQIMPGDVDRFRFTAQKGQKLVIETHARSLIPYLSDAVPGWFQAVMALYDDKDNEVAFVDDYRFNPDPVLFYEIPVSGEYQLEIRDSIYRGREDFVYRIEISQQPFITQVFPLGAKTHSKTAVSIKGWNMAEQRLPLDTRPSDKNIRHTTYSKGELVSNPITYSVDTLPEGIETESNNSAKEAQPVTLPMIINGRVDKPGDVDTFKFKGRTGDKIVAEVYARQLNSPLDSLLRLTDANNIMIEWNDDNVNKDGHLHKDIVGLATHQADSYIMTTLPHNGTYYVHLSDSQNQGGQEYAYRLRIAKAQGDFALRITPSSLFTFPGQIVAFSVHALRKDGFDGQIKVILKDAPVGFELQGAGIPAGCNQVRMTLSVPRDTPAKSVPLKLQGFASIAKRRVSRIAVPAEDMMQAFLYRHLVPSQQLLLAVAKKKMPAPDFEFIGTEPARIAAENSVQLQYKIAKRKVFNEIKVKLDQPPQGLTLHDLEVVPGNLSFKLKADKDLRSTGFVGNIIVEASGEFKPKNNKNKKTAGKKRSFSMGYLPAIPIEIEKH